MKLRVIHDTPEAVISRGFHRLHWQDFDAVLIVRPGTDKNDLASSINDALWELSKQGTSQ